MAAEQGPVVAKPGFAGRRMLAIASLAVFLSGFGQTYGVSSFVDPLLAELGWSRTLFSVLYALGTLASACSLSYVGRQIDRAGNRLILSIASVFFGVALMILSFAGGIVTVLIGFSLLRMNGAGALWLGARTLVPRWFHTRTGRAFSLLGVAGMASQAAIPAFNESLIGRFGWENAFRINAAVIWLVMLPVAALLVRNRPEEIGQHPDGIAPAPRSEDAPPIPIESGASLREARRTWSFWALIAGGTVPALVVTGLSLNQIAILTDRGLPKSLAATTFAIDAAVALPVTLLAGWLVDRYPVRYALAAGQFFLALAMVFLLFADTAWIAIVYAACRGIAGGFWTVAGDVAWPQYFGRRHLGSIRGFSAAIGTAGAALGPIPFGLAYDLLGGYRAAIGSLLILPVLAMIALARARPPVTEAERR